VDFWVGYFVLYFGVGQEYGALEEFDSSKVLEGIGFWGVVYFGCELLGSIVGNMP